ncbi:hypothetical protein [Foetidibacter luteolus]|uniref:hypothetical protein n=1 Tax=Foetidibacter luteolus TaxID=2608880 RepID=UPI001A98D688|nr:hypothetical protein [Foetidibacter luteolus]
MTCKHSLLRNLLLVALLTAAAPCITKAQTDQDAIMMIKNNFCVGPVYSYSSWNHYWEGTLKRDNQNLGTVSTQSFSVMGNYGITNRLNVLFNVPYVKTKATAGTLHGLKGLQDVSLWLKWLPYEKSWGNSTLSLYAVGGLSFPASNYTPDFLPLSIGLHSTNLSARIIADYQVGSLFVTGSGTYTYRRNIEIDRTSYYTDRMHLTNEVEMPNVAMYNLRAGYRSHLLIAEVVLNRQETLGGFDMRRNDMPFPSNKMNMTSLGAGFKYTVKKMQALSFIGGGSYVLDGRNVGQSKSFYGGIFYVIGFTKRDKKLDSGGKEN